MARLPARPNSFNHFTLYLYTQGPTMQACHVSCSALLGCFPFAFVPFIAVPSDALALDVFAFDAFSFLPWPLRCDRPRTIYQLREAYRFLA